MCPISIHALRVEGDGDGGSMVMKVTDFYPRPPGGGRHFTYRKDNSHAEFLSTPSGWRATYGPQRRRRLFFDFYPRPPGGGRLQNVRKIESTVVFLSTPSGWRATRGAEQSDAGGGSHFYPRPPGGGRPQKQKTRITIPTISIHALRVEGDGDCAIANS